MKKHLLIFGVFVVALLVSGESCLLEEKVVEIVIKEESCAEFFSNETTDNFADEVFINYGEEIDKILIDNGYTRDDIDTAFVESAAKGVISVDGGPWTISGDVTVTYNGQTAKIISYESADILALVGQKEPQALNGAGVALLNKALNDFINNGQNPVLSFKPTGDIEPDPTTEVPLVMNWKVWIKIGIKMSETFEVPEPPI